jgi:tRNA(Ile)-lysidine synthase
MGEPGRRQDRPVSPEEARRLFASLERLDHVALAVSGGSDSTALMWLAARWAGERANAPRLSVLTVDHGLRKAAASEARAVKRAAKALGLAATALTWRGAKPRAGVQAAAREARYRLMTEWCERHGAAALITAHTLDDQAETFLMRLARGSGLDGLASIGDTKRGATEILRPLLAVSRERLRATLEAAGVGWIEDPSNADDRFERVRMRRVLSLLEREGVSAKAISRTAERLARARRALDAAAEELFGRAVTIRDARHAAVDRAAYAAAPDELRVRLLQRILARIGGEAPELAAVERLAAWHDAKGGRARTLAGCRVSKNATAIAVEREGPRRNR